MIKEQNNVEIQSDNEPVSLPEPVTSMAINLRQRLSSKRWEDIVSGAIEKVEIVCKIEAEIERTGDSRRKCQKRVAPETIWSSYLHWWRRWKSEEGPEWERLLDRRVPPPHIITIVSPEIRAAVVALRHVDAGMSCETAREHLVRQFQKRGDLSDSTLRRIWKEASLTRPGEDGGWTSFEKTEEFHGGGGLALIGAAAAETGIMEALALAVKETGHSNASAQEAFTPKSRFDGRDEHGCFTDVYNHFTRIGVEPGKPDFRWRSDEAKRERCDLSKLSVLGMKVETLADHMLIIGMTPLITDRRGFDGLDGPKAEWLEVSGAPAYMPLTMDKTLAELALLNVGDGLWAAHGRYWAKKALEWSEGQVFWRQFVIYVDTTAEPYWTQKFALSGKVSRLSRVMPCLSRVALAGGPGVPLLIETCPGSISLKKSLIDIIERADEALGYGELRRLTVVDAEAASVKLLTALNNMKDRDFVTVLKGQGAKGVSLDWPGSWEPYRERDLIRAGTVTLQGEGAPKGGLKLYGVEMKREGSRHPRPTLFLTGAPRDRLSSAEVADSYLSRWPNQEQFFRDSRNGGGFEHSHGYGGEYVTNVAIETALEKSERQIARAEKCVEQQVAQLKDARALFSCTRTPLQVKAANAAVELVEKEHDNAKKQLTKAQEEHQKLSTMPRTIYKRDATRENIVTALQSTVILLIEFVLREYFGNVKMELRTFLEYFLYLPTTVRTSYFKVVYQIEGNSRNRERFEQLRAACQEITRRKLRRGRRLLVFEVIDKPEHSGDPLLGLLGQFL